MRPRLLPPLASSDKTDCAPLHSSYVNSWSSLLKTHELVGDNRLKFAQQLSEMSEELLGISKDVDRTRKGTRDLGVRLERGLSEQDTLVDKVCFLPRWYLVLVVADRRYAHRLECASTPRQKNSSACSS